MASAHSALPIAEIIKQAVVKVIKAADLYIQRQQSQIIHLQNAQKALENAMAELKLKEIASWLEKHQKLYEEYFQELDEIKQAIARYERITHVSFRLRKLQQMYTQRWKLIEKDQSFTPAERQYMDQVYTGILKSSLESMDHILTSLTPLKARMTDGERLSLINEAAAKMERCYGDFLRFNEEIFQLRASRSRSQRELNQLKTWYGVP